jgi:hypothetical protein
MKKSFIFFWSIPAILGLYQISLVLLYDIPSFVKGENSEVILYDSIGTRLYANAQASMHLAFGNSDQFGEKISVRTSTLANCIGIDRVHLEEMISTKGVRWRTYFARNGSKMVFKNDSEKEIKRVMYNFCFFNLLGFLPLIVLLLIIGLVKIFYKKDT